MAELDGVKDAKFEKGIVFVIGTTNKPEALDSAILRPGRLDSKIYVKLLTKCGRGDVICKEFVGVSHNLTFSEFSKLVDLTDGYSAADLHRVCNQACLGPIRDFFKMSSDSARPDSARPVTWKDVQNALSFVKPSVNSEELAQFDEWNKCYGSL